MGHDVPEYPETTFVWLVAPGQNAFRVGSVVSKEEAAILSDVAQLPGRDKLFGVLHHRDVTIHKADHALHPSLFDGLLDVVRYSSLYPFVGIL